MRCSVLRKCAHCSVLFSKSVHILTVCEFWSFFFRTLAIKSIWIFSGQTLTLCVKCCHRIALLESWERHEQHLTDDLCRALSAEILKWYRINSCSLRQWCIYLTVTEICHYQVQKIFLVERILESIQWHDYLFPQYIFTKSGFTFASENVASVTVLYLCSVIEC